MPPRFWWSAGAVATAVVVAASLLTVSNTAQAAQSCNLPGSRFALQSGTQNGLDGNNKLVAAEIGWGGSSYAQLRARTNYESEGPWEEFKLVCLNGPGEIYAIESLANGLYVSAEIGWTGDSNGLLRARATSIGPWERFYIPTVIDGWYYPILNGKAFIRSEANGKWVAAELGRTGNHYAELRARTDSCCGPWETFNFNWRS